jgi:hypothetical protein
MVSRDFGLNKNVFFIVQEMLQKHCIWETEDPTEFVINCVLFIV